MQEPKNIIASLQGVTKNYGAITALKDVTLNVHAGQLLAVLGPNGAGKTTSVRLLLGLSRPGAGTVRIFGEDPRHHQARTKVGAMLQVARVPETLKVREHIAQFRGYYPDPLPFAEIVSSSGLEGMENRLFGSLSGGEKQRVLFALAICGNPDLVFLDEPTVGLDVSTRHLIWQQIRRLVQQRRTVVLTTHYLEEVDALADRVVVLNQGVIVAEGSAAEIKSKTAQRKIRCVTRLTPGEIRAMEGVNAVSQQESRVEIHTARVEPVLRELFLRDPDLGSLELTNSSLEEAFLKIIKNGHSEETQEVTA
ncbi:MAG: ABC transporter ATP-binding protein [Acidobacteriia bacterium]|nr:ABC transporter ATP-binding protein [Terriglobia bacterium]